LDFSQGFFYWIIPHPTPLPPILSCVIREERKIRGKGIRQSKNKLQMGEIGDKRGA
jgi:hypothetical protein